MLQHDRPAECVRTLRPDDRRPADRISHFRGFGKRFFGNRLFRHGIFPCGATLCVPARFFCAQKEKIGRKKPCRTAGASRSRGIRDDCRGDRFSLFSVNKENRRRLKRCSATACLGCVRTLQPEDPAPTV